LRTERRWQLSIGQLLLLLRGERVQASGHVQQLQLSGVPVVLKRSFAAAVVASLLAAGPALAGEPSAADRETARSLMQEGEKASARKDHAAALEAFQGAHAIMGVPSTGMEVARTLVALGRLRQARKLALEVAALPAKPGEPAAFARARSEAAELAKSLEARVAKLEVAVDGAPAGSRVKLVIDGEQVDAAGSHELDPGQHSIEVSAGGATESSKVSLKEGETRRESITLRPPQRDERSEKAPAETKSSSKRTLGFVIGGIGVAGLATAGVTGLILLSRDAEIDENCPDKRCNAEGRELIDGSQPLLIANAVAWGVGVVGLGVGTWLVLSSDDSEPAPVTAVGPTLLPGGAGVGLVRSF
jgi:hypothetical protein